MREWPFEKEHRIAVVWVIYSYKQMLGTVESNTEFCTAFPLIFQWLTLRAGMIYHLRFSLILNQFSFAHILLLQLLVLNNLWKLTAVYETVPSLVSVDPLGHFHGNLYVLTYNFSRIWTILVWAKDPATTERGNYLFVESAVTLPPSYNKTVESKCSVTSWLGNVFWAFPCIVFYGLNYHLLSILWHTVYHRPQLWDLCVAMSPRNLIDKSLKTRHIFQSLLLYFIFSEWYLLWLRWDQVY